MLCRRALFNLRVIKIISFFLVFFFIGCKEQATIDDQLDAFNGFSKKFKSEIRVDDNGRPDVFYISTKSLESRLGLEGIEKGSDGLQIRIRYAVQNIFERKIIVVSYKKFIWTATAYYAIAYSEREGKEIYSSKPVALVPKSGWINFSNRLLGLNILTLPDVECIENCGGGGGDGDTYIIEIATKMRYRFYTYWNPEEYRSKCQYAKDMHGILKMLENEFDLQDTQHTTDVFVKAGQQQCRIDSGSLLYCIHACSTFIEQWL